MRAFVARVIHRTSVTTGLSRRLDRRRYGRVVNVYAKLLRIHSSRVAASSCRNRLDAFQSVLMRYSLGMPETSLSGRNTRIARNVRRSISRCMPCENAVMILPQNTHTPPHFTTYYSITLILTLLKYLNYITRW